MFIPNITVSGEDLLASRTELQNLILRSESTQGNIAELCSKLDIMRDESKRYENEMNTLNSVENFLRNTMTNPSTSGYRKSSAKKVSSAVKSLLSLEELTIPRLDREEACEIYKELDETLEKLMRMKTEDEESGYTSCSSNQSPRKDNFQNFYEKSLDSPSEKADVYSAILQEKFKINCFNNDIILGKGDEPSPCLSDRAFSLSSFGSTTNKKINENKEVYNKPSLVKTKSSLSAEKKNVSFPEINRSNAGKRNKDTQFPRICFLRAENQMKEKLQSRRVMDTKKTTELKKEMHTKSSTALEKKTVSQSSINKTQVKKFQPISSRSPINGTRSIGLGTKMVKTK